MKRTINNGFVQIKDSGSRIWKFYVTSFDNTASGENGTCYVLTEYGSVPVPIDAKDRILINGRRYDRKHWDH